MLHDGLLGCLSRGMVDAVQLSLSPRFAMLPLQPAPAQRDAHFGEEDLGVSAAGKSREVGSLGAG